MSRSDLERLSKEELIELVLRLHRPEKTSRTSSKPPASDRKERREKARPGGAKPGHEGHKRALTPDPDQVVEHRPASCSACGEPLPADLPAEMVSVHERIDVPVVRPVVEQHRRLCVTSRPAGPGSLPPDGGGRGDAVRAAAARGGDLPEDLPGAVLRAVAGGLVGPVRAAAEPGRADEPAAPRPRLFLPKAGTRRWRVCGRPRWWPRTRPGCASRAPTASTGCSAARRRWSITRPRAGLLPWSTR